MTAERLPTDDFDRRLSEALAGAPVPATPAHMVEQVRARLRQRRRYQVAAACGSAAALVLVALGLWSLHGPVPVAPHPEPGEVRLAEQKNLKDLGPLLAAPPVVRVVPNLDAGLDALEAELDRSRKP